MDKALLTFSNGETLELCEGQLITPISKFIDNDDISVSQCKTFELWYHVHDGLIPSICELLCKCDFFQLLGDNTIIYNATAVVTIKNL